MSGARSVAVLGGGVAGIAAAVRLAEAGVAVTLIETRKRLGGRATSHPDPATGELIDNCQHVLLGCCTNLIDLYERLGVADRIAWHGRLHFFDKAGRHDVLAANPLPAPLHLSASLLRFGTLTWREKLAIARAMLAMMRVGLAGRACLADVSFADWLRRHRQPEGAIEKFWAVIVISACNVAPERLSAAYALQVFQEGFVAHRRAYEMGVSTVPLAGLYDAASEAIGRGGGRVLTGTSVSGLRFDGRRVRGVEVDGERVIEADAYVSALPFERLAKVTPDAMRDADDRLARLDELGVSPIIGVHLWFGGRVFDWPHMIFVDSPLQWVFAKSGTGGAPAGGGGQYLHGVISAADDWVGRSNDEIVAMAVDELAAYAPAARDVKLRRGRAVKEKRATFAAAPGVDALRPGASGAIDNLLLAGDWTDTGWPATMEGAARSGYAAAGAVLGRDLLKADLPVARLCGVLGLR